MIGKLRAAHARRYELPLLSAPVAVPERAVPMDPYALGLLLGDGCLTGSTTPSFATDGPRAGRGARGGARRASTVRYRRRRRLRPATACARRARSSRWRTRSPAALRDARSCSVPDRTRSSCREVYLRNTAEVRLALLQGLLDTDGGPVTQADRTCRVQYTTTSIATARRRRRAGASLGGSAYTPHSAGRRPQAGAARTAATCHTATTPTSSTSACPPGSSRSGWAASA